MTMTTIWSIAHGSISSKPTRFNLLGSFAEHDSGVPLLGGSMHLVFQCDSPDSGFSSKIQIYEELSRSHRHTVTSLLFPIESSPPLSCDKKT